MKSPFYTFSISFIFLCLFAIPFNLQAQELERKGTFGAHLQANPNGEGIEIVRVIENTTASSIGILQGDIILSVNEKSFEDVFDLVDYIGTWRQNDEITLVIMRGEEQQTLAGKVVGKPLEKSENAQVIYGHVDFDGGKLRTILTLPHGVENPPVTMFLPGIGCASSDFHYNPKSSLKILLEDLAKQGVAVFRVEKPGMGDSEGTKDCQEMDYNYEVAAMEAGLKKLKTISTINKEQIFLFGHSLGVITSSVIAPKHKDIAGVIAWGGISTTWFEYILKIQRKQTIITGDEYEETDQNFREKLPFLYDFYVNKMTKEELLKNPDYEKLVEENFKGDLWYGLNHYSFFHTLNEVDIRTGFKKANCPVLALAGEYDIHTVDTEWAKEITQVVNHYRPNQGTYYIIPQTTHHYHTVPSMEFYNDLRQSKKLNSQYISEHFNHDVPVIVAKWIKKVTK